MRLVRNMPLKKDHRKQPQISYYFVVVFSEFLLKTNPDLPNGSNPTSTETERFILDVFCWIPMEATIFCLIFWIFIRVFATFPCFMKIKNLSAAVV